MTPPMPRVVPALATPCWCLCLVALLWACAPDPVVPSQSPDAPARTFKPINPHKVMLWDRQTTETRELLQLLVREFNAQHTGVPVEAEYIGSYTEIYKKVSAGIGAGVLPGMAVAYESMTVEYIEAGAVRALDDFVGDPEAGLGPADLEDFFPGVLESNRFAPYGNRLYSFPFSKSVLVLYFNARVLAQAGFTTPPATWDDFLEQCRAIKANTGKYGYAISVDASTVDAMIYSKGGEIVRGRETLFDSPESVAVFELIETLMREELAYQVPPGTFDDENAFAQDQLAFTIRTSAGRTHVDRLMGGDLSRWGIAPIPQADPSRPATVLFGGNVVIFNTTPEQERAAWDFISYFTSADVNVLWALGTGYLPIRQSASQDPRLQAFWDEWVYNRTPYDNLAFARPEPNLAGWQEVREVIEDAVVAVITRSKTGAQAASDLKRAADRILDAY
jgi:ABC-type glycerol-3-phosphate transport system substrate-binding protein